MMRVLLKKVFNWISTSFSLLLAIIVLPFLFIYYRFFVYRSRFNRPVYTFLPPIRLEFHQCPLCNSFDGGIYGKGPLEHFRSEGAKVCVHNWKKISKGDFFAGIKREFNKDLLSEKAGLPFWKTISELDNE